MDTNNISNLLNELLSYKGIEANEIPDIDLYMDQVTTFFNNKLSTLKRNVDDKLLTKTMINNYTKSQLLFPPENKKYSKQHIMLMTIIYQLKQSLSMNDIEKIMKPVIRNHDSGNLKNNPERVNQLYELYLETEKEEFDNFSEDFSKTEKNIKQKIENHKDLLSPELSELIMLTSSLVIQSNIRKAIAERIIDSLIAPKIDELFPNKKEQKK